MTFHDSSDFIDAIEAAAEKLHIRPILIEKDYWVTYVLNKLAHSKYADKVLTPDKKVTTKREKMIPPP